MPILLRMLRYGTVFVTLFAASAIGAAQNTKKFEYAVLVDSTGSMRTQFEIVIAAAKNVVHQIHDHGPVSVYRFQSERIGTPSRAIPARIIERAQDEDLLNRTIEGIYIEGGQTTLLDAIDMIAKDLEAPPAATEKIVILITDGEDRVSKTSKKDLLQKLTASQVHIYAIGLVKELEDGKKSKATDLLKSLANETGGRAVFPKSIDLKSVLAELAIPIE